MFCIFCSDFRRHAIEEKARSTDEDLADNFVDYFFMYLAFYTNP